MTKVAVFEREGGSFSEGSIREAHYCAKKLSGHVICWTGSVMVSGFEAV